jgi:NTP pyrophosphatase (non-canonical NTP hydrolase)
MFIKFNGKKILVDIANRTPELRDLLQKKGFSTNKQDITERICLIHNEVGEMIDAYKKGKGKEAEAIELADIMIRLVNIPLIFPEVLNEINAFAQMNEEAALYYPEISQDREISICHYVQQWKNRYTAANCMYEMISKLGQTCEICLSRKDLHMAVYEIRDTITNMQILVRLCEMYWEQFLSDQAPIKELIKQKMKINWSRPYRFGVDPNLFAEM